MEKAKEGNRLNNALLLAVIPRLLSSLLVGLRFPLDKPSVHPACDYASWLIVRTLYSLEAARLKYQRQDVLLFVPQACCAQTSAS
jgi:hypothetical protein